MFVYIFSLILDRNIPMVFISSIDIRGRISPYTSKDKGRLTSKSA